MARERLQKQTPGTIESVCVKSIPYSGVIIGLESDKGFSVNLTFSDMKTKSHIPTTIDDKQSTHTYL